MVEPPLKKTKTIAIMREEMKSKRNSAVERSSLWARDESEGLIT